VPAPQFTLPESPKDVGASTLKVILARGFCRLLEDGAGGEDDSVDLQCAELYHPTCPGPS
jgi:hypothetical protein